MIPFVNDLHTLDTDTLISMFAENNPDYIFINQVSNVTGTILPLTEISSLAREYNAKIIVDGSQSVGLLDINIERDGIDYLIFAGHKNLYSHFGVGGFISREAPKLKPYLYGGTGSDSLNLSMGEIVPVCYEPASPNIIAVASLNESLKWVKKIGLTKISKKKNELCGLMIDGLKNLGCELYLPCEKELHTSVVSFNVSGYTADEVGIILSEDFDIAVRTGYHCAPYVHEFLDTKNCTGTVRASVGYLIQLTI